jgi:hypothetical protein
LLGVGGFSEVYKVLFLFLSTKTYNLILLYEFISYNKILKFADYEINLNIKLKFNLLIANNYFLLLLYIKTIIIKIGCIIYLIFGFFRIYLNF